MATVKCGFCSDRLDVGNETKAVVALCIPEDRRKGIRQCDVEQWGNPKTRADVASADGIVRHVVQTNGTPLEEVLS